MSHQWENRDERLPTWQRSHQPSNPSRRWLIQTNSSKSCPASQSSAILEILKCFTHTFCGFAQSANTFHILVIFQNALKLTNCLHVWFLPSGMKACLMLAAIGWNDLQRKPDNEKVEVAKWSKRKKAWVLETRTKRSGSDNVPPYVKALMGRVMDVLSMQLDLPPIAVPELHRRGCDVPKPSKEDLRGARHRP